MPLKIGLVAPRFLEEDMRGGEEAVRTLFNYLDKRNEVSVLTSDTIDVKAQHSFSGRKTKQQYKRVDQTRQIFYFKSDPMISSICYHSYYYLAKYVFGKGSMKPTSVKPIDLIRLYGWGPFVHGLADHIAMSNYDVIHGSIFPTTISFQALRAADATKKPFVYTPYYHYQSPDFFRSSALRLIAVKASALIACTNLERDALIGLGASPDKVFVIPLAFDLRSIADFRLNQEEAKRELGLQEKFVILAHPWSTKGAIVLLRALQMVSEEHKDIALLTIGEPDSLYLSKKYDLIKNRSSLEIIDMGWTMGMKKWMTFCAADVFSMVSINDAFGLSYLDAWAFERPVIGARNTFAENVIRREIDGALVSREDPKELCNVLEEMIANPDLRKKMGNKGRERLSWEFSPERITREHEQVYEQMCS
jgi:glycosyltransferase involved in cell wall biosynthesis